MTKNRIAADEELDEMLETPAAFVKRLDGTFNKYESIVKMRKDLNKLQECVDGMLNAGLKYDTLIILMHHHTKIPQKTIKKVLEGLQEVPRKYFE